MVNNKKLFLIIFISLFFSIFLTIISSPGFFNSDSYARTQTVDYIMNFNLINNSAVYTETRFSILPILLMALSQKIWETFSVYTFLCAFFYFLASFLMIEKFRIPNKKLAYLMFVLNPVLVCVSVWNVPGILCSAMILFLLMILIKDFKNYDYLLLFICSTFIFGYRENAVIIIPLIFFYIIWRKNISKLQKLFCCLSILLSIGFLFLLTNFYHIKRIPVYHAGFAWEILNVIDKLPMNKKCDYTNSIANCSDIDKTIYFMKRSNNDNVNIFYWNPSSPFFIYRLKDINIKSVYRNIIKDNPKVFAEVKLNFIMNNLGIIRPLKIMEIEYNRNNLMRKYNFNDSKGRKILFSLLHNSVERSLIQYPYIIFFLSLCLVVIAKTRKSKNYELYLMLFLLSILYYSAFLIVTVSFEIRYFFPSYYLMCIMNIGIITELIVNKENEHILSSLVEKK